MRVVLQAPAPPVAQAPRHPEVNEESATRFEPNNQILAAPLDSDDVLAGQLRRHLGGLVRADEPRVVDVDVLERSSCEDGLEPPAYGLDLGQLGHASSLAASRRR